MAIMLDVASPAELVTLQNVGFQNVRMVVASWAHLRLLEPVARLLGHTADLTVLLTGDADRGLHPLQLRAVPETFVSITSSAAAKRPTTVRLRCRRPVPVSDLVRCLLGDEVTVLGQALRVGMTSRQLDAFVVGNPHARYVGVNDQGHSGSRAVPSVDLILAAERPPETGAAGSRGLQPELVPGHTGAGSERPVVVEVTPSLPPVDTWSLNPTGFQTVPTRGAAIAYLVGLESQQLYVVDDVGEPILDAPVNLPLSTGSVRKLRPFAYIDFREVPQTLNAAKTILQLSAAGVPLALPEASPQMAELLGPTVTEALCGLPLDVMADPLAREAVSLRARRAVMRTQSSSAWNRELANLAGHRMQPLPLVSVILVTRRPNYLAKALQQIDAQTWERLEIVVGLHGQNLGEHAAVGQSLRREPKIISIPDSVCFGDALNLATQECRGSYITKWDDDDLYGTEHIWDLMLAAMYSGAEVVGKGAEYVLLEELGIIVRADAHRSELMTNWVAGGTLLMSRAIHDAIGGWRPIPRSVDHALITQARDQGRRVYRTTGLGYILRRHGLGHTWDPGLAHFLPVRSRQWRNSHRLERLILEGQLEDMELMTAGRSRTSGVTP